MGRVWGWIWIGLCILLGLGGATYYLVRNARLAEAATTERAREEPEIRQCHERLAIFYKAYNAYAADHKGLGPHSVEDLVPKYIHDPTLLTCPTANRWIKHGAYMAQGTITLNRRDYPVTYGFRFLTAGFARSIKRQGPRAPLVVCDAHEEAMYRAVYHHPPPLGAFDPAQRSKWISQVQDAREHVVRRDGTVGVLDPSEDQ